MGNCLSEKRFANLLFVDVTVGRQTLTALFDTGASRTVLKKGVLDRLGLPTHPSGLRVGNNNGAVMECETAVLPLCRIGALEAGNLQALVLEDASFAVGEDGDGRPFPAEMLLGWDVISRFRWEYDEKKGALEGFPGGKSGDQGALWGKINPILRAEHEGQPFLAGLDTGHTDSMLKASWLHRLDGIGYREEEMIGIGSAQKGLLPYAERFAFSFQQKPFLLRKVDLVEFIPSPERELEALFGMDLLQGRSWKLDAKSGAFEIGEEP